MLPVENKLYRGFTEKIAWIADNVRPDLSYSALEMAKKCSDTTLSDLKKINHILKKVREKPCKVVYKSIVEDLEDLEIVGIGDASYKWDDKSVGGNVILLSNKKTDDKLPLYWKSKQIVRTVHASKDAETLNIAKLVDDSVSMARQFEILLYGKYQKKIPVKLYTDSEPTLESVASTKPIKTKRLRNQVQELKEVLLNGEVESFSWLPSKSMIADMLMKEMKMPESVLNLMTKNKLE